MGSVPVKQTLPLNIQALTLEDIPWAMQLVEAANWNQTPNDWRRVLTYHSDGCFKAVICGEQIGTVTTTRYESELGWIGMMLVNEANRRQGVGRCLMKRALDHLHQHQTATIKLDATPAGRPLYELLGFRRETELRRWQRPATSITDQRTLHEAVATTNVHQQLQALHDLDMRAFGVDRIDWLTRVAHDSRCVFKSDGFGMLRPGRISCYLGPIVSTNLTTTTEIITELLTDLPGSVIWDIFEESADSAEKISFAQSLGFQPVRPLTRMVLGKQLEIPDSHWQVAPGDPATG